MDRESTELAAALILSVLTNMRREEREQVLEEIRAAFCDVCGAGEDDEPCDCWQKAV